MFTDIKIIDKAPSNNKGAAWCFILLMIIIFALIVMAIAHYDLPKWGAFLLSLMILIPMSGYEWCTVPKRKAKKYLDPNGNIDLETPREYIAKKIPKLSILFGTAWVFSIKNHIKFFRYIDRNIIIENGKGVKINAPLNEIDLTIVDKSKNRYHMVYQLQYKSTKLIFVHNYNLFEEEEIDDINNILSNARSITSTKLVKTMNFLSNIQLVAACLNSLNDTILNITLLILNLFDKIGSNADDNVKENENKSEAKSTELSDLDRALGITMEQKNTDAEIAQFIRSLNNKPTEFDDDKLKHFMLDSTDEGRKMLLEAYERNLDYANRVSGMPLLCQSEVLNTTYQLELKYHILKANEDDLDYVVLFQEFLVYIMICIILFCFDGLSWGWNILICLFVGILLFFTVYDKILKFIGNGYETIKDKVENYRVSLIQNSGQCDYSALLSDIDDRTERRTYKIIKWISLATSIALIIEIYFLCLYF